ncbi:MAG: hypothetical protein RLZZ454_1035, partial [Pseudomonadota bacterium]
MSCRQANDLRSGRVGKQRYM